MEEIWKDIDDFPGYQVSSEGRVRCFRNFNGKITSNYRDLKPLLNKDDYYYVDLYTTERKQVHKRIHRLVADAFLGPRPDMVVNHIDGNKHRNVISNLEWVTPEENSTKAAKNGLYKTRPVRIIETGEVFRSFKECTDAIGGDPSNLSNYFLGKLGSVKGLHFELAEENECDFSNKKERTTFLFPHQMDAVSRMFDGCILNGGVGSGKSLTGLYYYFKEHGGCKDPSYIPMVNPCDLVIITTAKKRNDLEWEGELAHYLLSTNPEVNYYKNTVIVDSWQNIQKYVEKKGAFFIFDEDHVTGSGAWVKAFYKITRNNRWIILSATSGDKWEDYIPVFVANGFYKNKTELTREHFVYSRFSKYPKIERYMNEGRLIRLRNKILIDMDFERHTIPHHEDVYVQYDIPKYKDTLRTRWDPYKNEPIQQASGLCYVLRRIVNSDEARQVSLLKLYEDHPKMIIFYNFDYERDILLNLYYGEDVEIAEYSGHAHQPIPSGEKWVYLVNYTAGCEGFNCIKTDTIVFFSQNYSYKVMIQAAGRIDRLNTPFQHLYYFHLKSRSGIDLAISRAIKQKKKFNETRYVDKM